MSIFVTDDNVAEAPSTPGGDDGKPESVVDNNSSAEVLSSSGTTLPQSTSLIGSSGGVSTSNDISFNGSTGRNGKIALADVVFDAHCFR